MPLVHLTGVTHRYGDALVLDDVSFEIAAGEFIALLGRSGSGKSTLLRILGGLEPPNSGTVSFDGKEITSLSDVKLTRFRRHSLGFVFQAFNLVPTLTAAENIAIPLHLNGYSAAAIRQRVSELLRSLGVSEHAGKFPETLSGGEQQRVAIARALAHRPKLVVADEPTGNLDDQTAVGVMEVLTDECRAHEASLIVATHSDEVRLRSDRTFALVRSRIERLS